MSGKLSVVDRSAPIEKHDRVVFDLDDGQQLRFNDVRKFGKMWAVIDPEEVTGAIGPEPLAADFDLPKFRALVQSRSGAIKPLLLNQTFLAGVGNIYADESLWRAKIHPLRKADSLSDAEIAALYRSIRQVLRTSDRGSGHRRRRWRHRGRLRAARVRARRQAVLSVSSTAAQDRRRPTGNALLSALST